MGFIEGGSGTGVFKKVKFGCDSNSSSSASSSGSGRRGLSTHLLIDNKDNATLDSLVTAHNNVVVFSIPGCPYCVRASSELTAAGVDHVVVKDTPDKIKNQLQTKTSMGSFPSVWVGGTFIGGCNDGPEDWMGVVPCIKSGKVASLITAKTTGSKSM